MERVNMTHLNSVRSGLVLDHAALLDSVGGDVEFLVETVGLFLAACPTLLSQMREALGVNDFTEAALAARILRARSVISRLGAR
jgi:hypothetical protein